MAGPDRFICSIKGVDTRGMGRRSSGSDDRRNGDEGTPGVQRDLRIQRSLSTIQRNVMRPVRFCVRGVPLSLPTRPLIMLLLLPTVRDRS